MLNEFCVLEIGAGLDDIIEVSDKSVFLCCQCDSQLSRFSRVKGGKGSGSARLAR